MVWMVLMILRNTTFMLLAVLLWSTPAPAAIINAASCLSEAVQTAIDRASPGDTVTIPAGACTWTTQVYIGPTKAITLQGAGERQTVITDGGTISGFSGACTIYNQCGWSALLYVGFTKSNAYVTRVTALTINFPAARANAMYEIFVQGNGLDKFRIDHVTCTGSGLNRCIATYSDDQGASELSGLVDHVTCNIDSTSSPQCFNNEVAFGGVSSQAWKWPAVLGSNHATYWEDLTCIYQNTVADSCFDNYEGQSWVLRFSTFIHIGIGNHGVDSAYRGAHLIEAYRNTFSTPVSASTGMNWRSGPNILFDNSFSGPYGGTGINIGLYRSSSSNVAYGITGTNCTGSNAWDGNLGTSVGGDLGYPCLDQVGWFFPPPAGCTGAACVVANGSQAQYFPAYMWGNTYKGSPTTASTGGFASAYVHINSASDPDKVDIYTDVGASCSGASCTAGIGRGTLADRPGSCTTGVGYWATDQGTWNQAVGTPGGQGVLYKCTATNKWSLYYTPYIYPHPLQTLDPLRTLPGHRTLPIPPAGLYVK